MQTEFEAEQSENALRIDVLLARRFCHISRADWKRKIASGCVLVNGKKATKNLMVFTGQRVAISGFTLTPSAEELAKPNPQLDLSILFEDDVLIAVAKPAGMASHPLNLAETNTALNAIIAHSPSVATAGPLPREGGLVHRLDNQTSGVLVAAKSPRSYEALHSMFHKPSTQKTYWALVVGEFEGSSRTIDFPIAHHASNSKKMVAVGSLSSDARHHAYRGQPRSAISHVYLREKLNGYSLLEVVISQGQRHQIRAHLAGIGHPICGDSLYQDASARTGDNSGMSRHALHAIRAQFLHPTTLKTIALEAPLPADFEAALTTLRAF